MPYKKRSGQACFVYFIFCVKAVKSFRQQLRLALCSLIHKCYHHSYGEHVTIAAALVIASLPLVRLDVDNAD